MDKPKLVLIGAGSTVFTPGLLADLASSPVFDHAEVHLVDLDADAAQTMARLGRRIARARGSSMTVHPHVERREALPNASLVATTIAVGGAERWRSDLEIPLRHGVRQTVGDTVGPGGVLRALRQVPELVAIGRDVAELAPAAWLINYANPLTANVRALTGWAHPATIGLCHGTLHTKVELARALGLPHHEMSAVFAGINHLCWLLDIRHGNRDLYPALREKAAAFAEPVTAELMRLYGLFPAPGDRHVAEFFDWYLGGAPDGKLPWGLQPGLDETHRYINTKQDLWDRLHRQAAGEAELDLVPPDQEAERLVAIAEALLTGEEIVELAVNVPNDGKITGLPPEAVVEVPAVVNGSGITGQPVGDLPAALTATLSARCQQQELTVQAAIAQSRTLAVQALALDPLVPNPHTAAAILDDAVATQPRWLDAFADTQSRDHRPAPAHSCPPLP